MGNFTYNLRFPGQYYDAETGKHYNYFRDYDPSIGRYLAADPVGIIPAGRRNLRRVGRFDPNLNHLYGYVLGNPLSFTDPLGLTATSPSAWDVVRGAARGGARGRWGGAAGLALGIGLGAMSEMCKPTPQERCESDCTEDNKRAAKFCHAMAVTKGGKQGTPAYSAEYSKCMDEQDEIYIQCIQDCKKEQ